MKLKNQVENNTTNILDDFEEGPFTPTFKSEFSVDETEVKIGWWNFRKRKNKKTWHYKRVGSVVTIFTKDKQLNTILEHPDCALPFEKKMFDPNNEKAPKN